MPQIVEMDDQPISATFFGEGRWLTGFITPDALEVQELHKGLTQDLNELQDKLTALWYWVASEVKYTKFVKGKLWIDGKSSVQNDLWNLPGLTSRVKVGNCVNKAFLLTSLIRNELPASQVSCVLGNLYNGKAGGHAWVNVKLGGIDYIMESTRSDVPALVLASMAERYEAIHYFNDQEAFVVEGRTLLMPMTKCYSTWLVDYLDWAYIESQKGKV